MTFPRFERRSSREEAQSAGFILIVLSIPTTLVVNISLGLLMAVLGLVLICGGKMASR